MNAQAVVLMVADLGNSRLKLGSATADGELAARRALPVTEHAEAEWGATCTEWGVDPASVRWRIAAVNPPLERRFTSFLERAGVESARVERFASAVQVPQPHALVRPEFAGVDRALAVLGARRRHAASAGRAGVVVCCGTALTVEFVDEAGVWLGGAIALGLASTARALHEFTALLPLIEPRDAPDAIGPHTLGALEAGVFWGAVGTARELIERGSRSFAVAPWVTLTGGDAARIAPWLNRPEALVVPDLVLEGLASLNNVNK